MVSVLRDVQGSALWQILLISCIVYSTEGYRTFQDQIPNGKIVPHPCKANYLWAGVGHENEKGGGARNRFGEDFDKVGNRRWTLELCNMDSDGDGMTNGEELGDPDCTWQVGQIPSRNSGLSHPGVCDEFGSSKCAGQDSFVSCELEDFRCDQINRQVVNSVDIRFPTTKVPSEVTSYFCMKADLPSNGDYFLIAAEALLDNLDVMHHMVVYGCQDHQREGYETPQQCSMDTRDCTELWVIWTVGLAGQCLPKDVGFRFGQNGYSKVLIEIHWNNPFKVDSYYDSSGVRLYYEPNRADLIEAGVTSVFQSDMIIPPGKPSVNVSGTCTSECSYRWLNAPIQVFDVLHHMHYMGKSQVTTRDRNGEKEVVMRDPAYSYDSPIVHRMEPTFEIRPGDEVKTVCEFNSLSKSIYTFGGEATSDEMCVAFFLFYPASAHNKVDCGSFGTIDFCSTEADLVVDGCVVASFFNFYNGEGKQFVDDLRAFCNIGAGFCTPECAKVVEDFKKHPCYTTGVWDILNRSSPIDPMRMEMIARLSSCSQMESKTDEHDGKDDFFYDDVRDNSLRLLGNMALIFGAVAMATLNVALY